MKKVQWWHGVIGIMIFSLGACATTQPQRVPCDVNVMDGNGRPCWVNNTPQRGVVVHMAKHIKPEKTREILFQKAVVELAATSGGLDVSQDAVVNKVVKVQNDNVSGHSSVTTLAVVTTANESIVVKAKVYDSWADLITQKVYMWVVLEGDK